MSPSVAVVTDSTAYLGQAEAAQWGITVVPLHVIVGGRELDDVAQIDAEGLAAALRDWAPVTTSRPAPQRFADVYEAAAARGAVGVVSMHLSGEMSGTVDAARLAAEDALIPVEVIDSRSIGMGLGFPVLAAAKAAANGAALTDVVAAATRCVRDTRSFFYVDTLEYLRRGGRIGTAANILGSALAIKPLLHFGDGSITLLEKVRTANRAIARLEDLAVQAAGQQPVSVAVQHLASAARAEALAEKLEARLPEALRTTVVEMGAVIGVHTGPGMLGVTISPEAPQFGDDVSCG